MANFTVVEVVQSLDTSWEKNSDFVSKEGANFVK
jgi:hypothetical protein